ncbi:hypothetical protein MAP00_000981 [Monascus purpureus]|nr:hypothetical protein MAP00_000981 [Monascus purpureus]
MGRAKSEQRAMWSDFPHNIIFPGINLPDDYSALLKKYLQIAPYEIDNPFDNPIIHHPEELKPPEYPEGYDDMDPEAKHKRMSLSDANTPSISLVYLMEV